MITLLLVDDHELFRSGLRLVLDDDEDFHVLAECSSGEEAVEAVRQLTPDVVLMDVNMPGMGGLEATRLITAAFPATRVIAVTVKEKDPYPQHMLEAGATGFLSKGCSAELLTEAIRTVHEGETFIPQEIAQALYLTRLQASGAATALATLSPREVHVMQMIAEGLGTHDIAEQLYVSPKTVSTYRQRIYKKLGVRNDVEISHAARRYGMLDDMP